MEAVKVAGASAMEAAANLAASAKSGLEKTKAVVGEKVEKLTTSDPIEKDMSTLKKQEKIMRTELSKREAYAQNASASMGRNESYTATGKGDLVGHDAPHVPTKSSHGSAGVTEDVVGTPDSNTGTGGTRAGSPTRITEQGNVGSQDVVDPSDPNTGTGRIPVGSPTGTTKGVVGSQYPDGENTESGRTPVRDDEGSGHTTVGGMSP